jgi:Caspase domain
MSIASISSTLSSTGYNPADTANVYRMDYPRRGHLVVVNNRYFEPHLNLGERSGTDVDASKVYAAFKKLGFEVFIHTNVTRTDMLRLYLKCKQVMSVTLHYIKYI